MAITNHERVGKALDLLKDGLRPFIARECEARRGKYWITEVTAGWTHDLSWAADDEPHLDVAALLKVLWDQWHDVFRAILGHAERSLVSELREVRNQWAHQEPFSSDDAYRALDSAERLLAAVSAVEADEVNKMKLALLRVRFDEQVRQEQRRTAVTIESAATGQLKPWREVVTPHRDVASGQYQQAEFAADLWQVHLGEGSDEYRDPVEFFRRTFLTESLRGLLTSALRRLSGQGGDPVVQLQTNFGGGKTHSMLALLHLVSGAPAGELAGIDQVLLAAGITALPKARPVVLVGNKISPGNPVVKADGTVVRTLWGELAYQLGGRAAYDRIAADDQRGTSPGDVLRELFNDYGPCLILIDEWVAYARQLHDGADLPGGSFETHFTFAQALTESAKLAQSCLLVISLPASDTSGSPHAAANDVEVGGERGRAALERLRNAVGRVESSWRPASAEEGFEIVRRRLFEPIAAQPQFVARDTVAKAFADFYRSQRQDFPAECRDADYEKRLKDAYPIHPEVFDRLYEDWSTLIKFQRTRGVLRLMAAVIHCLWEKGDRNALILPANIAMDDRRVQFELTRYLSDNWAPVIEKDVDGSGALPGRLDAEVSNLGKYAACRRVARTIYLGSAPTATAANKGLDDRRVKLGCLMPGEPVGVFDDALRRLAADATYLYQDGKRYWYSTQPTVTKLAEDRAEEYRQKHDKVVDDLAARLRADLRSKGEFSRVHPLPSSGGDVPDDPDTRLVVLGLDYPYSKQAGSPAELAAKEILASRGPSPRRYQNALVFLAADQARLQDLEDAVRRFLAWDSIVAEKNVLDLSPHQVRQAETQRDAADQTAMSRLPETYQWLLAPVQPTPQDPVGWEATRLAGTDSLAVRASKKLRHADALVPVYAATSLRAELDRIPLWPASGGHLEVRELADYFARFVYLPRLCDPQVLFTAVRDGLASLLWESETFAYADSYDEIQQRYRGLRIGVGVQVADTGLVVKPAVARAQIDREAPPPQPDVTAAKDTSDTSTGQPAATGAPPPPPIARRPRRYHGTVELNPARVGLDASKIAEEIVANLTTLVGAQVRVTLEIEADVPDGVSEHVVRTVTENGRTLKFDPGSGFEIE